MSFMLTRECTISMISVCVADLLITMKFSDCSDPRDQMTKSQLYGIILVF